MTGPQSIDELHELASRPTEAVERALRSVNGDVLVIGAGGKMGLHLAAMLQRGLASVGSHGRVIAVSRFAAPSSTEWFSRFGIKTLSVDLLHDGAVTRLPDASDVFFLAGVKFGTSSEPERLRQLNVELPARVAKRFADARIVAFSTGCVYAFAPVIGGGSVETDSVAPVGKYAESCLGREQAFRDNASHVSLIRLNYSVDLRYGVLVDIATQVVHGQPIDVSTGYVNVIWQGDANRYVIQALPHAASPPFILNVTGQRILRVRDIAQRFAQLFETTASFTGQESDTAWLSNASRCFDRFGPPTVGEATLMEWVADWIKAGGEMLDKPTHFEVRDGKF